VAHDLQAQDRAFRLGQTKDTEVYRFISAGTIEETMYQRQIYKQQLANICMEAKNEKRYCLLQHVAAFLTLLSPGISRALLE